MRGIFLKSTSNTHAHAGQEMSVALSGEVITGRGQQIRTDGHRPMAIVNNVIFLINLSIRKHPVQP